MKKSWKKGLLLLSVTGLLLGAAGCGKEPEKEETIVPGLVTEQAEWKALKEDRISRVSVHDPSIFREEDENGKVTYYLYGTHITSAKSGRILCLDR